MKYQIKILLISICMLGISLSEGKKNQIIPQDRVVQFDPNIKHWGEEDKNIKDPELQKLLEELKIEFKSEKENLKKQFKKRIDALKEEYSNKRNKLKKKYRKKNKKKRPDKKPESLNPDKKKKKNKPQEIKNDGEVINEEKLKKGVPLKKVIDTDKKTIDKK